MAAPTSRSPSSPGASDAGGLRASDSERDEAAGELGEHFAAGRLSHDTYLHRMNAALGARRRADLPPLLADLPPRELPPAERVRRRLTAGWSQVREEAGAVMRSVMGGLGLGADGYQGPGGYPGSGGRPGADGYPPASPPVSGVSPPRTRAISPAPAPLPFPRGSGGSFTIGRDLDCDLTLEDPTVSREHAILQRASGPDEDGWLLTDQGSTNGTRVNGWRVRGTVPVRAGDIVRFGEAEYTLTPSGE